MARDSILDEAEGKAQKQDHEEAEEADADEQPSDGSSGDGSRQKLTQRMPSDLVNEVDRVQEEYGLGSRNATINFMVKKAAKDL
jgi:hypothetical protein